MRAETPGKRSHHAWGGGGGYASFVFCFLQYLGTDAHGTVPYTTSFVSVRWHPEIWPNKCGSFKLILPFSVLPREGTINFLYRLSLSTVLLCTAPNHAYSLFSVRSLFASLAGWRAEVIRPSSSKKNMRQTGSDFAARDEPV